jgi:16S rRNA (uracil1498-N3)-methyltransferase
VSAPLFLLEPGELDAAGVGADVVLAGPEGRHAVQVRRIAVGERVDLADGAGTRVEGVVRRVDGSGASAGLLVTVQARSVEPPPVLRLVLVQALAKGDRDVTAVEAATELGVDGVVPWQAERSVVVWRGDRAAKSRARWLATARAAAKQSRRARVPSVSEVVGDLELAEMVARSALTVVLHEDATEPLAGITLPAAGDVLVVVGPEGGISSTELERLATAGARVVRLGGSVLRSSTAGPAALAVLSARARWA